MPSASTISAEASSMATESSLLLRARPVSVAQKNSKLMVDGRWRCRPLQTRGPRSKRRIVPWIGARQFHRGCEPIGFGGCGVGCGDTRRRPAGRGDRAQVVGKLAAVGIAHLGPLLERERDRVGKR